MKNYGSQKIFLFSESRLIFSFLNLACFFLKVKYFNASSLMRSTIKGKYKPVRSNRSFVDHINSDTDQSDFIRRRKKDWTWTQLRDSLSRGLLTFWFSFLCSGELQVFSGEFQFGFLHNFSSEQQNVSMTTASCSAVDGARCCRPAVRGGSERTELQSPTFWGATFRIKINFGRWGPQTSETKHCSVQKCCVELIQVNRWVKGG